MTMNIGIFLPTRSGSERVVDKNTRPFAGYEYGLLQLKLEQLVKVKGCTIYLSTNDSKSMKIASGFCNTGKVVVVRRPEELCLCSTPLKDLIAYVPTIVKESHILWTHVTSPFVGDHHYQLAMNMYGSISVDHDSLMSVRKNQEFLWSEKMGTFVNFKRELGHWPRTQDLEPLYEVNNGIFCAPRQAYLSGDRIGTRPKLLEMSSVESLDIDWVDDFELAEMIHDRVLRRPSLSTFDAPEPMREPSPVRLVASR